MKILKTNIVTVEKLYKMMFLKYYCTEFVILLVMVCIPILSLEISNYPFVFRISLFLLEFMNKFPTSI